MKLSEVLKMFDDRLKAIEHTVNDVLVKSFLEADEQYEYDTGLSEFKGKHPEFADMDKKMSALQPDYDTGKILYDARPKEYPEGQDEDAWVAESLAAANEKLDALLKNLTGKEEAPVEEPVEEEVTEETVEPEEISDEQLADELKAAKGE